MTARYAGLLLALPFAIAAAAAAAPARAPIVIYRCTDLYGRLTVQNDAPCPKGTREQRQVVEAPPPMPAYQPLRIPEPATPAPPPAPPTLVTATEAPAPPPPLFQCSKPDGEHYFSEAREPEPRCVALQVVGLDGSARNAGGAACEVVRDACTRVPDADTCEAWQRHLRAAETAWRFGSRELAERQQAEFERIQAVVAASSCARPPADAGG